MFENLSEILQPYKGIIGSVASVVTIGQFLSGGFICKDVYKKGSTEGIPANPFIGGIVIGVLMLKYAAMLDDSAMLSVNLAAIFLNIAYLLFYFVYCKTKGEIYKALAIGAGVVAVLMIYISIENPDVIEYRFGLIVTVLMLALIGSPLLEVKDVINKKDASVIPFPIVFSGTIVSILWLLYGIILLNDFMIVQNFIGLALCIVQLTLCYLYPGDKKIRKKAE